MSYFDPGYAGRLQPYVNAGMSKNQLAIGVDTSRTDGPPRRASSGRTDTAASWCST